MPALRLRRLPALCRSHCARRADQPLPARRRRPDRDARGAHRTTRHRARPDAAASRAGSPSPASTRPHASAARCASMPVPWTPSSAREADAHGAARSVHRVRAVPAALPGRLHRDASGRSRVEPGGRARGASAVRRAQPAPRAEGTCRPAAIAAAADDERARATGRGCRGARPCTGSPRCSGAPAENDRRAPPSGLRGRARRDGTVQRGTAGPVCRDARRAMGFRPARGLRAALSGRARQVARRFARGAGSAHAARARARPAAPVRRRPRAARHGRGEARDVARPRARALPARARAHAQLVRRPATRRAALRRRAGARRARRRRVSTPSTPRTCSASRRRRPSAGAGT